MKFSEKLIKLRKNNHYSQEQLADLLDVSRQAVSKWESGQTYPEMDKLLSMCKIFKCSLDELTNDEISDVDISNKRKSNLTNALYEVLEMIGKTFSMVKEMNFRQIVQCVFELSILIIILLLFRIPFSYVMGLGDLVFETFHLSALGVIWNFILNIIYVILFVIVFVFIYKTRYLDRVVEKEKPVIPLSKKEEVVVAKEKDEVTDFKRSKKKNFVIFDLLGTIFWLGVKVLALGIGIPAVFGIMALVFAFGVSIFLIFKGVFYIGIILGLLFCILLNYLLLEILFHFLLNYPIRVKRVFVMFMTGIIGVGLSCAITFFEVTSTTYIPETPVKEQESLVREYMLTDRVYNIEDFYYYLSSDFQYIEDESLTDRMVVEVLYYPEYITVEVVETPDYELTLHYYEASGSMIRSFNLIMDHLAKKQVYDYSQLFDAKVIVKTSKANIERLEACIADAREQRELEYEQNQFQSYQSQIFDLEQTIGELRDQNDTLILEKQGLEEKILNLESKIEEYQDSLKSLLE